MQGFLNNLPVMDGRHIHKVDCIALIFVGASVAGWSMILYHLGSWIYNHVEIKVTETPPNPWYPEAPKGQPNVK